MDEVEGTVKKASMLKYIGFLFRNNVRGVT